MPRPWAVREGRDKRKSLTSVAQVARPCATGARSLRMPLGKRAEASMNDVTNDATGKLAPGDVARLKDTLVNFKVVQQHVQHHTIDELQFYPDHSGRTESPA